MYSRNTLYGNLLDLLGFSGLVLSDPLGGSLVGFGLPSGWVWEGGALTCSSYVIGGEDRLMGFESEGGTSTRFP